MAASRLRIPLTMVLRRQMLSQCSMRSMSSGELGSGAGKGGGSGGSVREAGGSFGKMEAAKEEQYFHQLQKEQLDKMKEMLEDEVTHHERQIRQHMDAIEHHKKKLKRLHKKHSGPSGNESD